jgi:beta-glucosidase/6-phospho-beta-glucosidase/beta-galactosidase
VRERRAASAAFLAAALVSCSGPGDGLVSSGSWTFPKEFRFGLPMRVTENGVATPDGSVRAKCIVSHLKELQKAIEDGYDATGYLHWSLIDNFEWLDGFDQRFGLYTANYSNHERTMNEGGEVFREVATDRSLSPDLVARYRVE